MIMYKKFFLLSVTLTLAVSSYSYKVYGEIYDVTGNNTKTDQELKAEKSDKTESIDIDIKKEIERKDDSSSKVDSEESKTSLDKRDDKSSTEKSVVGEEKKKEENEDKNVQGIEKAEQKAELEKKDDIKENRETRDKERNNREEKKEKAKTLPEISKKDRSRQIKQYDDGLLEITDGYFKYIRIPGIKISDTGAETQEDEEKQVTNFESPSSEEEGGLFGIPKGTTDFAAKVVLVLIIALMFIIFKIRSRGKQGTNVLRRFPKG